MNKAPHEYQTNIVLQVTQDTYTSMYNLEVSLRAKGKGEMTSEQFTRIGELLAETKRLRGAWIALEDLVDLERMSGEGLRTGAPTAKEWRLAFDMARKHLYP